MSCGGRSHREIGVWERKCAGRDYYIFLFKSIKIIKYINIHSSSLYYCIHVYIQIRRGFVMILINKRGSWCRTSYYTSLLHNIHTALIRLHHHDRSRAYTKNPDP